MIDFKIKYKELESEIKEAKNKDDIGIIANKAIYLNMHFGMFPENFLQDEWYINQKLDALTEQIGEKHTKLSTQEEVCKRAMIDKSDNIELN